MGMRIKLLWRSTNRWASWGHSSIVSVGTKRLRISRHYSLSLGPVMLWVILPTSASTRERELKFVQPALRRVAKRLKSKRRLSRRAS